ncbi:hypothetical protein B0H13DRAFT_1856452 [Mycena leptocephala]|nr:hypothetical protein B0H13DRAFT_1856452 [Mycena leptocephala]
MSIWDSLIPTTHTHHGTRNSSWKFKLQKINKHHDDDEEEGEKELSEMVYELSKLAVDSQEVQVNENEEVEAVIFDGGTTSARAAREARDGAWVQIGSLYYL